MKSRPMIFSSAMVRAILAGQKTQTRRVVKDESLLDLFSEWPNLAPHIGTSIKDGTFGFEHVEYGAMCGEEHLLEPKRMVWQEVKCPYGVVGDRIWVKEGYAVVPKTAFARSDVFQKISEFDHEKAFVYRACFDRSKGDIAWKSPLFMPRDASRIELEITGIRVERVQEISEADAIAEGVEQGYGLRHVGFYQDIWDSINGKKYPWESNPWVWVVEFKRVGGAA